MEMKYLSYILVPVLLVGAGFFAGRKSVKKEEPKIKVVYETKTVSVPVYRNYAKMNNTELQTKLLEYDTGEFRIAGKLHENVFDVTARLGDRQACKSFGLYVGRSGNWKIYAGIAVASLIAGGYAVYKIRK